MIATVDKQGCGLGDAMACLQSADQRTDEQFREAKMQIEQQLEALSVEKEALEVASYMAGYGYKGSKTLTELEAAVSALKAGGEWEEAAL